jgi:hypothetical protein
MSGGDLLRMFYDYIVLYRICANDVQSHLYGFDTAKKVRGLTTYLKTVVCDKNMNHEYCKHKGTHLCRLDVCLFTHSNLTWTKLAHSSVVCLHMSARPKCKLR